MLCSLRDLHYPEILNWFRSHPSPPVAIISDFFLGWTQNLASEIGVRRIVFSPSAVVSYSINLALSRESPGKLIGGEIDTVTYRTLPNSPKFPWYQVNYIYRNFKDGDPDLDFYKSNWVDNRASWGVVFNSFAELERVYIEHAKNELGHDRVWAVGPVLPSDDVAADLANRGGSSAVGGAELMTWLDNCEEHSVVYVCFGSRHVLTREQMDVLAIALEKSGVHFVWVVRGPTGSPDSDDDDVIPDGFEDRVVGRGFLIKGWAPQVAILRHRAFLTHCGWNSTLEGISAGVVMLTWPIDVDQFANARVLVDQAGVGIRVGESTQNIPDMTQLARVLTLALEKGIPERSRANKLSAKAARAVNGGCSKYDLNNFVEAVNQLGINAESLEP